MRKKYLQHYFSGWQDMDPRDKRIWQAPDLSTELTFEDYRAGRDPAMNAILHYKPTDILRIYFQGSFVRTDDCVIDGLAAVPISIDEKCQQGPPHV
jgi:hypothetical protein